MPSFTERLLASRPLRRFWRLQSWYARRRGSAWTLCPTCDKPFGEWEQGEGYVRYWTPPVEAPPGVVTLGWCAPSSLFAPAERCCPSCCAADIPDRYLMVWRGHISALIKAPGYRCGDLVAADEDLRSPCPRKPRYVLTSHRPAELPPLLLPTVSVRRGGIRFPDVDERGWCAPEQAVCSGCGCPVDEAHNQSACRTGGLTATS